MREETYIPRHASKQKAPASPLREAERRTEEAPARTGRPAEPQPAKPKKKPSAFKALLRFLLKLLIVAAIGWALLTFVLGVFVVHTNDMYPAIRDGDLLITYRIGPPTRGAIIAYTVNGCVFNIKAVICILRAVCAYLADVFLFTLTACRRKSKHGRKRNAKRTPDVFFHFIPSAIIFD